MTETVSTNFKNSQTETDCLEGFYTHVNSSWFWQCKTGPQ